MRPVIGIVPSYSTGRNAGEESFVARERYCLAVEAAGGAPIVLPITQLDDVCQRIFPMIDGFLLTGGQDISPTRYGCPVCPMGVELEPQREELEYRVIRYCHENDVPLMGICRGMQIMNVYFGGTLVADLPTAAHEVQDGTHEVAKAAPETAGAPAGGAGRGAGAHMQGAPDKFGHASPSAIRLTDEQMASLDSLNGVDVEHWQKCDYATPTHQVNVVPDSKLSGLLGCTQVDTNSMHHQGICKLAPCLKPVAYGPDGLIEAIEEPTRKFMLGVQWHPEFMRQDRRMSCLFSSLISACRQ